MSGKLRIDISNEISKLFSGEMNLSHVANIFSFSITFSLYKSFNSLDFFLKHTDVQIGFIDLLICIYLTV